MIPVNLLPHRAQKRAARQKQFIVMAAGIALIGVGVVILVHGFLAQRIDTQLSRNKYLDGEIAALDKQIDEIKKLKEQTRSLLARKQVVEALQSDRTEAVRLIDQLVRQLPEGLHLKSIKQTGNIVNVQGFATSNARVSTLMRNFEASPWLESPTLVEIKAAKLNDNPISEFSLNVKITRTHQEAEGDKKTAARHPGGPPAPSPSTKS
jgi:type IV pilus assembly protein PilN